MAKKDKKPRPTPPPTTPAAPTGGAVEVSRPVATDPHPASSGWVEPVVGTVTGTARAVRGLLPTSRVPVYLAATALLVTGLVDPPVALGVGLAYEALRRWEPATPV